MPNIPGGICFDTSACVSFENFTTSIDNIHEFDNVIIGPNPTSDILFIKNLPSSQMNISLSSINGSTVLKYISPFGQNDLKLDLSNLIRGTYYLKIEGEFTIDYSKVIKL